MSAALRPRDHLRLVSSAEPQSFRSVEAAWFWCMSVLLARQDGAGHQRGAQRQICEADDIVKALDRLYRQRRVDLSQARVLRIYGEKGVAPNRGSLNPGERTDATRWEQAMRALEEPLRLRGIVAKPKPEMVR
jgi:hypothetical protein